VDERGVINGPSIGDRQGGHMKRWKKITLVLLGLIIISQLPFVYRRQQLGRLRETIAQLNSQRVLDQNSLPYADYKGVIHVHSMLGGHSTGNFTDIIQAANANRLDFVVMTEHPSAYIDTAEMTLKGTQGSVLFINGSEISAANQDRLLLMPGDGKANADGTATAQEIIAWARANHRLAFVAYPQEYGSLDACDYDGIEVYNLYTNARRANPLILFFDGLWSYGSYPDLLFIRFYERPSESLKKWDELLGGGEGRRLVAIAGNDAHANIGFNLSDAAGKQIAGIKLDPYERSFGIVRNHVLLSRNQPLNTEALLAALAKGHSYLSFDLFCDAAGFRYTAWNGTESRMMGDEISLADGVRLTLGTPVKSRIKLIKDGALLREATLSGATEFLVTEKGVYRVEAYLDQLPKPLNDQPWIISNPIYVR
jgi:hypothetical protein